MNPRWSVPALLAAMLLAGCGGAPSRPATEAVGGESARADGQSTGASAAALAAPTPAAVDAAAVPPPINDENSVYFARGATVVDAAGEAKLRRHAERLKENPRQVVTLVGHTDHLGSRSYNLAIAEQRTAAVAELLRAMGVSRSQLHRYSVGSEKPGLSCRVESCRKKMRRVDIVYRD